MMGWVWLGAVVVIMLGAVLAGLSFVPDDAMIAIPLPEGTARRRLLPVGVVVMILGLVLPPVGYSVQPPPITPTPTITATTTGTAVPTIPLVPTVTPTATITPTRGTPAPSQLIREDVTPIPRS